MKGKMTKVANNNKEIPEYERKRLEKLKYNAERMKAQGFDTLANKFLQDKCQEFSSADKDDDLALEDDDDYIPESEGISKNSRSMAAFVELQAQKGRHQDIQPIGIRKQKQQKFVEKQKQQQVVEKQKQQQEEPVHEYVPPQNKKQQKKVFCMPGSLSTYLGLKKQQMGNMILEREKEIPHSNSVASDNLELVNVNEAVMHPVAQQDHTLTPNPDEVAHGSPSLGLAESTNAAPQVKKFRGQTKLPMVHARTRDERIPIFLNSVGQPIGPTEKSVNEFSRFLGTIAKDSRLTPLNYIDWPSLDTHEKIWEYVLDKYIVPEEGKKWVLETVHDSWRIYKSRVKKKYYYAHETDELRLQHRPPSIPEPHFRDLLNYWNSPSIEVESKMKRCVRENLDDMHTMGPKSYAMLRHKLQQENPNKEEPSQAEIYKHSRKRKPEKIYKTSNLTSKDIINQMDALQSEGDGGSSRKDPYYDVMTKPEHHGRVRLYGKGVTKSILKNKVNKPSCIIPQEFMQSIEQSIQSRVLQKLAEANPGLVIPPSLTMDTSNSNLNNSNGIDGASSVQRESSNEVHVEENEDEQEEPSE